MLRNSVENIVKSSLEHLNLSSVSEMTFDQLANVLSESIYKSITSREYAEKIDEIMGDRERRRSRGGI